jgi:hypothetical protein
VPLRKRRAGLIEAQGLVTDLRIMKADFTVEGILLACTGEHGAGGVHISALDVRERHVECEVRSRRSERRGTRIRLERRVVLLCPTSCGAEIHPVRGFLWCALDERLGHRDGLAEALGELQAGIEHHAGSKIARRPREHRTRLGLGLRVFALGQQLTGAFDGCGRRSGSVHGATPYEEKGRVANATRPFRGQTTSERIRTCTSPRWRTDDPTCRTYSRPCSRW